jgi:hypothetical protein
LPREELQKATLQKIPKEPIVAHYETIQFNASKEVISDDGDALPRALGTGGVLAPEGATTGVRVNTGGRVTATVGPDGEVVAIHHPKSNSINMGAIPNGEAGILATAKRAGTPIAAHALRPTDLVTFEGQEMEVQVAERIGLLTRNSAGHIANGGERAVAEATGEAAAARAAEAAKASQEADQERASLNTHPVPEIEDAHAHFTTMVQTSDQIGALVQLQSTGKLPPAVLHRVAEQMGMQPERAVDSLNAMSMGIQAQFKTLARSRGMDPDQAADWLRTHRSQHLMSALQRHALHRDVVGAWDGLIGDFKRATQGANRGG